MPRDETFAERVMNSSLGEKDKLYIANLGILYKRCKALLEKPFMPTEQREAIFMEVAEVTKIIRDFWKNGAIIKTGP